MGDWMDVQIAEAIVRGAEDPTPAVTAASYQKDTGRVLVDLANGCSFMFPARSAEGLEEATDEQLAQVEVLGVSTLHWEDLDVDLSVPHLMAGLFGTRKFMAREIARRGGQARSEAKAAAARENGKNGGRPRKPALGQIASVGSDTAPVRGYYATREEAVNAARKLALSAKNGRIYAQVGPKGEHLGDPKKAGRSYAPKKA